MIRFITGLFTVIAGVAAVEGTVPLGIGILISLCGIVLILWGLGGMRKNGELNVG